MIGEEKNLFGHEEADVSIISYLYFLLQCDSGDLNHIQVRCDDTDILLLLVYFYWNLKPGIQITMKKFNSSAIDINATAENWVQSVMNCLPCMFPQGVILPHILTTKVIPLD